MAEQREPGWEYARREEHVEIEGTLHEPGDQPIRIEIDIKPREKGVNERPLLVCIHGSHSSAYEYADVAADLSDTAISIARISTSRHHDFDPGSGQAFFHPGEATDYMTTGFSGKTYDMEVEDFRRAMNHLLANAERIFGVPAEKLKVDVMGTSLGSTIAAELTKEFGNRIESLVLAAPAAETDLTNRPILDTFPSKKQFLSGLEAFTGRALILRGATDPVVKETDVDAFQSAATKAEVTRETLAGGHTFGLFDFDQADREKTRAAFVERVKAFLAP